MKQVEAGRKAEEVAREMLKRLVADLSLDGDALQYVIRKTATARRHEGATGSGAGGCDGDPRGRELRGMSLHRRMLMGNPNA